MRERRLPRGARIAVPVAVSALLAVALGGCGQMGAALDKQWMTVQFSPNTSRTAALQVRAACSHIENAPVMALPAKQAPIDTMYGVRFDTTNASPANLEQLQTCLQRFRSVLGVDPESAGDEGS